MRSSERANVSTPQPSTAVGTSLRREVGRGRDLCHELPLKRVPGQTVASRLPTACLAHREEAGVLARAVVVDRPRRPALLLTTLEVALRLQALSRASSEQPRSAPAQRGAMRRRLRSPRRRDRAARARAGAPGSASRSSERSRRDSDRRPWPRPRRPELRPRARDVSPRRDRPCGRIR